MNWNRTKANVTIAVLALLSGPGDLAPQSFGLLDPDALTRISAEISGDAAYEHIRQMSRFHRPRGGADGLWTVAEYVRTVATEYGLQDVRLIKQDYVFPPWNASFGDLRVVEPWHERIASTVLTPLHLADYSRQTDIVGVLVDVGAGAAVDLDRVDVENRVVLTYGNLQAVMREAVGNRGALGVVWYPNPFTVPDALAPGPTAPDQLRWSRVPPIGSDEYEPTFAFILSLRQGLELRQKVDRSSVPVEVRARVESEFNSTQGEAPWQVMVEGVIRGREADLDQDIVLTAHIQEEGTSANDNASGSASILEIARTLDILIRNGDLPRPRRTIRFWWTTENSSERQYFADHPEQVEKIWVNINQDMVGADQSQDLLRKQNVSRLPATRFHFLNDVMEAVLEHVVANNTMELAQVQAGIAGYPRPHVASLGSRHRFNAEAVYFHLNTDHMTFLETPIGIPGIAFTNFPDRFIHSSDDDLGNIDRTQLGRNALAAALMTYIMANAGGSDFTLLAAEVAGRGAERLGRNLGLGLRWMAEHPTSEGAYHRAVDQVRFAVERERSGLTSLNQVQHGKQHEVQAMLRDLEGRSAALQAELDAVFLRATGRSELPIRDLTPAEEALNNLRPVVLGGIADFNAARSSQVYGLVPPGLHLLMSFEVLNAIDGKRSGLDIFRFVAAQAREAGEHYYGRVEADDVLGYLRDMGHTGLVRLDVHSETRDSQR